MQYVIKAEEMSVKYLSPPQQAYRLHSPTCVINHMSRALIDNFPKLKIFLSVTIPVELSAIPTFPMKACVVPSV